MYCNPTQTVCSHIGHIGTESYNSKPGTELLLYQGIAHSRKRYASLDKRFDRAGKGIRTCRSNTNAFQRRTQRYAKV